MSSGQDFTIQLKVPHRIRFTRSAFSPENDCLWDLLEIRPFTQFLVLVEDTLLECFPKLSEQIAESFAQRDNGQRLHLASLPGGEMSKRSDSVWRSAVDQIELCGIDRHSYVFAIGGGAFLDVVGFAAATAHRGIRLVRFPTTTLSQDDSGVGVKNGINLYGKKNFLGSFAVPYAVVNDFDFLETQPEGAKVAGLVEAVKVAAVKDSDFFVWIEKNVHKLRNFQPAEIEEVIERSALLHAAHIAEGGDPFEQGSSRPLDYGHWSAHKLEQLTDFALSHADAVSIGICIDSIYAERIGLLQEGVATRIVQVLRELGLPQWHEALDLRDEDSSERQVVLGLEEFREHLGGELTVLLLKDLGEGIDVHALNISVLEEVIASLAP